MIELDDLKNIWSSNIESDIGKQSVEQEKIRTLLKNKSTNIIDKVRTNLLREIIMFCVCLLLVACVPVYLQTKEVFILCAIIVVVIFIPYLIYYLKKYRELKRFFSYNENMKHSLQLLIQQLEKYLSIYFWGSLLLTPVSGFLLCFVILYEMKALGFLLYFDVYSSATLSMILSFALLLTLISYPVMKWYIRKLYGQHLEKLKDCLRELEEVA
jgi:hypothetical protein